MAGGKLETEVRMTGQKKTQELEDGDGWEAEKDNIKVFMTSVCVCTSE